MTVYIVSVICLVFILLFTAAMIQLTVWAIRLVDRYLDQEQCEHTSLQEKRWVEDDSTCMVSHNCPDCGFYDRGHVYADPETWATNNNPDAK